MKPYFVEPERLKCLLKSAEEQLGSSPKEAQRHVTSYLKDEATRYAKNPKNFFFAYSFGKKLSAPVANFSSDKTKDSIAKVLATMQALERQFIITHSIQAKPENWAKFPSWTQQEAIYVMRGLDFTKIMAGKNVLTEALKSHFPTFQEILEVNELAKKSITDGTIDARTHPVHWINWARENDLPVIENLPQLVLAHTEKTMTPEQRSKYEAKFEKVRKEK
jgi:hypothetical protein